MASASSASARIRVGVVGLGRLWEARHKPALARMKDQFRVVAVYDHVARRAEIEASQLGCRGVGGVASLVDAPDVDALMILAPQWFGSHPIERAARAGKPIYSGLPLAENIDELTRLDGLIRSGGSPFMVEFAPRFYPATTRLRELLASAALGRPLTIIATTRLLGSDRNDPLGPASQAVPGSFLVDPGQSLLDWAKFVVGAELGGMLTWTEDDVPIDEATDQAGIVVHLADGATARFVVERYRREMWGVADQFLPRPGVQVLCDRGAAWLEWPDLIRWTDGQTIHDERVPTPRPIGETLLDQFHRMIRGEDHSAPTWNDALIVAGLVAPHLFGFPVESSQSKQP